MHRAHDIVAHALLLYSDYGPNIIEVAGLLGWFMLTAQHIPTQATLNFLYNVTHTIKLFFFFNHGPDVFISSFE